MSVPRSKWDNELEMYKDDSDGDKSPVALWAIFEVLIVISGLLFAILDVLKEIHSDTNYTSASADYLENVQNILEDIRSNR